MRRIKNKLLENNEQHGRYSISPIFLPLVLIAIAVAVYYYIQMKGFFPLWIFYFYVALKIFIVFEVIITSAKTIIMPFFTIALGLLIIFISQVYSIQLIQHAEAIQIILLGIFGFLISLWVKW